LRQWWLKWNAIDPDIANAQAGFPIKLGACSGKHANAKVINFMERIRDFTYRRDASVYCVKSSWVLP
jgi:hypothetical protein